ncbi:hypothetical protein NDU88_002447 [Pleurodeles waltl]|uniref:Alpha-1,2-Mannosidase n=1 Tax=Pleurodeles waltl TaxID=8319 RepID=A0AAV7W2E3_PLEWA|nr:hypothetical protein NDU88_002447 [Pleurodeles waltl]
MFDEYMKGLEKKLCKLEEEITGKKQRKYIRDFKDYQAGRILTFQRKYDHMYESSTDVEVRNTERNLNAWFDQSNFSGCWSFVMRPDDKNEETSVAFKVDYFGALLSDILCFGD